MRLPLVLCLAALAAPTAAAGPLDAVPAEANLALVVDDAPGLLDAVTRLPAVRSAPTTIPALRELLATTPVKRFGQFVAFAERELGAPWPQLLDRLAGHGAAVAVRTGGSNAPALLVLDGRDEALAENAFRLLARLVEDGGAKPELLDYAGAETLAVGGDFFAARRGARLFASNNREALRRSLDLAAGGGEARSLAARPEPAAARKLLDPAAKAWLWFDLEEAKKEKGFKDFLDNGAKELFVMVVLGGTVDAVRRAPSLAVGLSADDAGVRLQLKLPAKRAELSEALAFHAPAPGDAATLPPLMPPGVLLSQSVYLDLNRFWQDRLRLAPPDQRKILEKAEKDISKFLPNTTLPKLLEQSGPHHRFVASRRPASPLYGVPPGRVFPSFASVSTFRDPAGARSVAGLLRLAAVSLKLAESVPFQLTMSEAERDGVRVVTYRYAEGGPYDGDPERARYNFAPSFAVVGRHVVLASDPDLIRDLVPQLRREESPDSPAVWRAQVHGAGAAEFLRANPDEAVATTVLNEGATLPQARKQVADLCDWLATLGDVGLRLEHGPEAFAATAEWKASK